MSYYDLDAILTDAQKVPCTFTLDSPHLGYLDNTPSHPLTAGTTLSLPLWLGHMLAISSPTPTTSLITLDLPLCLSVSVLNALKASSKSVDLRAQAPNFYALGARMLELFEEEEILDVLTETWRIRAAEIGDFAGVGGGASGGSALGVGTEGTEFLRGLEEWERALFKGKHESSKAAKKWMSDVAKRK